MNTSSNRVVRITQTISIAAGLFLTLTFIALAVSALQRLVPLLVLVGVVIVSLVILRVVRRRVVSGTILEVDLDSGVVEQTGSDPVSLALTRRAVVVRDLVDALDRGAEDPRILGLVARLGNGGIGLGHAQELRDAVHRFREKGKKTVAFAESFGESRDATVDYYLATAFETIYLQPMGGASVQGRMGNARFVRGALDKLGIYPDFDHRKEYKAAMYMFTETALTDPHREAISAVTEDQLSQIIEGIAANRRLDNQGLREIIDRAPLNSDEALEAGLVDKLGHRDDAYKAAGGKGFLFHDRYLKKAGRPHRKGDRIALIYGTGSIARGSSRFDPLTQGPSLGADDVAEAFRNAVDNGKVKGIVFRVDSPGGSAVASEVIRREVVRAREAGKPVVVSMGNVAGSGGYWISADADRIVAQPGTITGSIGVVAGKLATREGWARAGITFDQVSLGKNAGYWSSRDPYTPGERERLESSLDDIYHRFTTLVAEGRGIDHEEVQSIAKGRIWTGAQAKAHGLVDELGGMETALAMVKRQADIDADQPVQVTIFPEERTLPIPKRRDNSEPIELAIAALVDVARGFGDSFAGVQARLDRLTDD